MVTVWAAGGERFDGSRVGVKTPRVLGCCMFGDGGMVRTAWLACGQAVAVMVVRSMVPLVRLAEPGNCDCIHTVLENRVTARPSGAVGSVSRS